MMHVSRTQRWCAALCYIAVGFLWYMFDENLKKTSFLRFHVKQALMFLLAVMIMQVFVALLFFIPYLWALLGLILLIIGIAGILNALLAKKTELPVIGKFAEYLEI